MKRKSLLSLALCAFLIQTACAQDFNKARLDSFFNALETNNKFMGSVAISRNGEIIYTKSVGFVDVAHNIKPNENSKYRIGSISKTFTAVLVFKAAEEKKLDLNQTIEAYFPSIKNAGKIKIAHLLRHRSGIANFTAAKDYLEWSTQAKTEKEMVEIIAKGGSIFEPDSKAEYSNSNYVLLTYILQMCFNKPYATLLKEIITDPLDLKNTSLGGKINPKNNECNSYYYLGNWNPAPETDSSIPLGAGGIASTPVDLVKFSNALFGGKLLQPESLEQMKTLKDSYGMGLFQYPFYDKAGFGHTGGIDGFTSIFANFADGNISYALTSNGTNYNNNNISIAILSAVYNRPYDIPVFKTYNVKAEDLDKYTGIYSSSQIPLKITISRNNNTLIAQATGQSAFPLEATDKDTFSFDQAGVEIVFNPAEKSLIIKQGGMQTIYKKE